MQDMRANLGRDIAAKIPGRNIFMSYDLPSAIVIPVLNRARLVGKAIRAALAQSHPDCIVIVVDDGSSDGTWDAMQQFADHPDVALVRLARNLGAGPAKNVGLMLTGSRAVSFHDSDDRPHPDKLLRQARALGQPGLRPDPCLNWGMTGRNPASPLEISAVFTHHELILPDGRSTIIRREVSVADDLLPNAQINARVPGEWLHINSGLFHPRVFAQLGGYAATIEEDREFRNRLILSGHPVWVIEEPLLTKIETADSLTQSEATDYLSPARTSAREAIWREVAQWMKTRRIAPKPVDLPQGAVTQIVNPGILAPSAALATPATRQAIAAWPGMAVTA